MPLLFLVPVPLPILLVIPFDSTLSFGAGMSDNLLVPVPLPEEIVLFPAAAFLAAWICLNCSPVHFEASLSTSIILVPLPERILILTVN